MNDADGGWEAARRRRRRVDWGYPESGSWEKLAETAARRERRRVSRQQFERAAEAESKPPVNDPEEDS
jgi:hypothetical protein